VEVIGFTRVLLAWPWRHAGRFRDGSEYQNDPHAKFFVSRSIPSYIEKLTEALRNNQTSVSFDQDKSATGGLTHVYTRLCLVYFILLEVCGPRRAKLEASDARWQDKDHHGLVNFFNIKPIEFFILLSPAQEQPMSKTEFDRLYITNYPHNDQAQLFVARTTRKFIEKMVYEMHHGRTSATFDRLENSHGKGLSMECLIYFTLFEICGSSRSRLNLVDCRFQDKNLTITVDGKITVSW